MRAGGILSLYIFKSIIIALAFLNVKIPVLKQLATLKFTGRRKRLLNIKTALFFVVNQLGKKY